uniref:Uncharacterized protein n=1 Tax=Moniliophthora roreri TaxID=221103 RepID=A0A0W0F052_MONRR
MHHRANLSLVFTRSFSFVAGVLVTGSRLRGNTIACSLAIISCIIFLGSTKLFIYAFLTEKVWIVWSGGLQTPRHKAKVYGVCGFVMLGYLGLGIVFLLSRWSEIRSREGDTCYIGVSHSASVALMSYDISQTIFFTAMFLWPFWRSHIISSHLRGIARRTLCGTLASLTLSAGNASTMIALGSEEPGWVSLNALILYWISSGTRTYVSESLSLPHITVTIDTKDQSQISARETFQVASRRYIIPISPNLSAAPYPATAMGSVGTQRSRRYSV